MESQTMHNSRNETIPKGLEEIIYASVEKAIQTILIDQGYLHKRNKSRSHSRSRSRSRSRSHSRGPKHHKGRHHGKSRSRSRSHSRSGRAMRGHHFHHHHHIGPHPTAEMLAEEGWPRHKGGHKGWGKKHLGRRFPFAAWSKCLEEGQCEGELLAEEGWPRHKGGHKGRGRKHYGRRFPFAAWSKRCQEGQGGEDEDAREGDNGSDDEQVVETINLVDEAEPIAEAEKDLQNGLEKMNVNDSVTFATDPQ